MKHSKNEFANGKNHINGIENFWGYAKHRLSKFKGIKKENFLLHLKECEFRYNTKTTQENLYQKLLKLIRENPLKFCWPLLLCFFLGFAFNVFGLNFLVSIGLFPIIRF